VAFELIFGTAVVNNYLIYRANYAASDIEWQHILRKEREVEVSVAIIYD
jgi:hypothetical protein